MGDEAVQIFADKDVDVDWDLLVGIKEAGTLTKLQQADKNQDKAQCDQLLAEAEQHLAKVCGFKVNKDDSRVDVENLTFLFEFTQALLESKVRGLKQEDQALRKAKEKIKKQREETKEFQERIAEQDKEIEQLMEEMQKSVQSPQKGKGGESTRSDAEYKSLQKQVEALKDELNMAKRDMQEEKTKAQESNARERKAQAEKDDLQRQLDEQEERMAAAEAKARDDFNQLKNTRAKAQKVQKETFKFVKEVSELNEKNAELEERLAEMRVDLDAISKERLTLKDELDDTKAQLVNTQRLKNEIDADRNQLREKVSELTLREEERDADHEDLISEISEKVKKLQAEKADKAKQLKEREAELREAEARIKEFEKSAKASEQEKKREQLEAQIRTLNEEKSEALDSNIQLRGENKSLRAEVKKMIDDEKKVERRLQAVYKARENEVRATIFERQSVMDEAQRKVQELEHRLAEKEDKEIELESHISQLESKEYGMPEANSEIRSLKRELATSNNRIASAMKDLNDAWRKMEDLYEEVRMLRDHVKRIDPSLKTTAAKIGFVEAERNEKDELSLQWTEHGKPGFTLDISAYKVKTAMELEKARAATLQLEREVEALETERLEMKSQLRHLALQRGERAAKLGMSASDIEKLDAFAEQLKDGNDGPLADQGPSAGEKNKMRKMQERLEKTDKDLKEKEKELAVALETINNLREDQKSKNTMRDTIDELNKLKDAYQSQFYLQQQQQQAALQMSSMQGRIVPVDPTSQSGSGGAQVTSASATSSRASAGASAAMGAVMGAVSAPMMSAGPLMAPMASNVIEQLARALRDGDLGNQATVEVTVGACRNLPFPNSYVIVGVKPGNETQRTNKKERTNNPAFNETLTVPVVNRQADVVVVTLMQLGSSGVPDEKKDLIIGKVEVKVADFGKRADERYWAGSVSGWMDLINEDGTPVIGQTGANPAKASVDLRLQFVEAPKKRVQVLETELDSLRQVFSTTKDKLTGREQEVERLQDDLNRKTQDLVDVRSERDKARDELRRSRMNAAMMPEAAAAPSAAFAVAPGGQDGGKAAQELQANYTKALNEMGELNAFLIQTLDELSKKDDELNAVHDELRRYKEDLNMLRMQQVLLYKEHASKTNMLQTDSAKILRQWTEEKLRADVESSKAASALQRLSALEETTSNDELKKRLIQAERAIILLQADQDMSERIVRTKRTEEAELRARYDELVVEMARQEKRLKQRIGSLDRSKRAAEQRLTDAQNKVKNTVPKEDWNKLKHDHMLLQEKYKMLIDKEQSALQERATSEGQRQMVDKLRVEQQELKLELAAANDRSDALTARLEHLAIKDGPPEQQLLAALSEKLVKLEVSERNAVRRSELAQERMKSIEKDSLRLQDRIMALEEESVENVSRIHELEESDRELRDRMEGSISADQARQLRAKVSEQESDIAELRINANQYQELADLASDQAKAMEELHGMHLDELDALRACVNQLQSESDDKAEDGALQRQLLDRERQIHELKSKVATLDRELVRMDEYVVRLEDTLEKKTTDYFKQSDDAALMIKKLERDCDELRGKLAGSVPLDKADEWAQSLRDLTEHKHKAVEQYSVAKKEAASEAEKAHALQIQLDDQKLLVKQLTQQIKDKEGAVGSDKVESITGQSENLTSMKLENLRLNRLVKQLQEREAHLEHCSQLSEKEVRKLEEQLVMREEETGTQAELKAHLKTLRARVEELESAAANPSSLGMTGGNAPRTENRYVSDQFALDARLLMAAPSSAAMAAAEGRSMDQHAIEAMRQQVIRLADALKEKEDAIEKLNKELDLLSTSGGASGTSGARREGGGGDVGGSEAAQHTQQVARLTIDRLEKNLKRKTEMVTKYQEQLREAREQYMQQKELDNAQIEQLREELATKTHESIQNMRSRVQQVPTALSGPAAVDADAVFAEKDEVIQALNAELQSLKRKNDEQQGALKNAESKLQKEAEEVERLKKELERADSKKPSQVLETLVVKLKNQIKEKEKNLQEMKSAIESLRTKMLEAAENQAKEQAKAAMAAMGGQASSSGDDAQLVEQSTRLKQQVDELQGKLEKLRSKQRDVQKQLDDERERCSNLEKDKEALENTVRTQATSLRKAERQRNEAQDMAKQLKASAESDAKRIGDLEKRMREADRASSLARPASRRGADAAGDDVGGIGQREEATRRWEAEKRLEQKVERLTGKLKEHRREFEALESQHAAEKERMLKDADKLRVRVDQLEDDNKQLKARLRGAGAPVDSDDVLARVREAERRVLELQEHNERLTKELNVDKRTKADSERHGREELDRQLRIAKEELDNKEQQLRVALQDKGNAVLNERSKEVHRLEVQVGKLRTREEALEADLLAAQNEIVRLRFETEHSELRLQRWQRRVRELESLPLAVGKADKPEGADKSAKRKTKDEEEMERFIRSTKTALEKLHRENENLRANSASNQKYMDVVRENKTLKQAIGDRDRELVTLGDKLNGIKDQLEKKAKIDEKCRSLERQLKGEIEKSKILRDTLSDKERRLDRLEADLAAARESVGGDGMVSDRVKELQDEMDKLSVENKALKRAADDAQNKVNEAKWERDNSEKRAREFEEKYEHELRAKPTGRIAHDERAASQDEVKELREKLAKAKRENEELKGELNCFDPAFFDEIEDLKYNHNEMVKLVDRYETLLSHLSQKFNFDFTPQGSAPRKK